MRRKYNIYGFHLPSIFGYSTFGIHLVRFDNWGHSNLGESGWYLEWYIGPPKWPLNQSILLKKIRGTAS